MKEPPAKTYRAPLLFVLVAAACLVLDMAPNRWAEVVPIALAGAALPFAYYSPVASVRWTVVFVQGMVGYVGPGEWLPKLALAAALTAAAFLLEAMGQHRVLKLVEPQADADRAMTLPTERQERDPGTEKSERT